MAQDGTVKTQLTR